MQTTGDLSLYFHIPFCHKKCPYCHFYVLPYQKESLELLVNALELEWQRYRHLLQGNRIISIYFGGGTPFLLSAPYIEKILSWISPEREVEITLEANPESSSLEELKAFSQIGINRVSLGVQSMDDALLRTMGRRHTAEQAQISIEKTLSAGIQNITIDLMYEIPYQTLSSWEKSLLKIQELPIQHLSLYNLTFEPHTLFFKQRSQLTPFLPSLQESADMLRLAVTLLENLNFKRYEISAFAKEGYRSQHNIGYWTGRPFLGFGPSAFSYWEKKRYRNCADLKKYISFLQRGELPIDFEETLSPLHSLHERLALHLRLLAGVDKRDYPIDPSVYQKLENKNWVQIEGNQVKLSEEGKLFYDSVAEEIILL